MTDFEDVDLDLLKSAGANKWTAIPGQIGTFVAESDYGTAPAITEVIARQNAAQVFGYSTAAQQRATLESTARWLHDRYAWQVQPRQIRLIPEVLTGLEAVLEHHTRPGSAVIVPTPTYMPLFDLIHDHGREVIEVPLLRDQSADGPGDVSRDRWHLDLDAIADGLRRGAGLVLLLNPHNPTGQVFDRDELLELSAVVADHDARVWADEVWAPLIYAAEVHPGTVAHRARPFTPYASLSEVAAQQAITTSSISKGWNVPGLKTAFTVYSNPADLDVWRRVGRWVEHTTGFLGILATEAAFDHGRDWLDELVIHLQGNRDLFAKALHERLPEADFVTPQATYLGWIGLERYSLGPGLRSFFSRQAKIALTDGASCGTGFDNFVRVNFATPRPVIEEIVERLGAAIERKQQISLQGA